MLLNVIIASLKTPSADEELPMTFKELPIHDKTIKGLNEFNYLKLTHIQQLSIPKVLSGRDLLASATTGIFGLIQVLLV